MTFNPFFHLTFIFICFDLMGKEKTDRRINKRELEKIEAAESLIASKASYQLTLIKENISVIESQLVRFNAKNKKKASVFNNYTEIWLRWLDYDIIRYEIDEFAGIEPIVFRNKDEIWRSPTLDIFWNSTNVYQGCSFKWPIRFTAKAKKKILLWTWNIRENLLQTLLQYACGLILPKKNCKIEEEGPCANMVFLSTFVKGTDSTILFALLLDKLPIIRNNKVVQYKFSQYLKVLDIVKKNNTVRNSIEIFRNSIRNDPDRWIEPICDINGQFIFPTFENSVDRSGVIISPKPMSRIYLSSKESEKILFSPEKNRWFTAKDFETEPVELDPYKMSIVNKLGTAATCAEFINFLKKIPDFQIKLTEEQENLIGSPGNVLAIGRSGTGKTTCSLLRLLSTEIVFRYAVRDRSKRFTPEDLDRSTLLHTVFVTASPVLTNEVKRFYGKLGEHIKDKLKKKEKIEESMEVLDLGLEENLEVFESDSEDDLQGPASMEFLRDEDFPLFVTVRKVIFMVDAAMKRPFFARDHDCNVIGSNSKFQWHNELKGALVINKEFKQQRQTEDIGKIEISSSDSDEELEFDYQSSPVPKKGIFAGQHHVKKQFRHLSYEVDFKIFSEKFYPRICHKCSYSALLLWTEISAYIKGSAQSFRYSGYYLPRSIYANLGRKMSMLTTEAKYEIWELFILYERWKVQQSAYDMQDVVNYLLNQISFYGYNGVPIHYMMIDEVQDLTPATISLLLLLTKQKLFFSGDTAQTIAKGVGFRFCDLKSLFSESKLEMPIISQLTMNFRTHKQILGLANSVVALLETMFPLTIDKMGKEISPLTGPMPAVINSNRLEDLMYIIFGALGESNEKQPEFGCNQVVIVRNQESKANLPSLLRHALCLTVFEAKGLEFDDVILYNFFTETEADSAMWSVLRKIEKKDWESAFTPQNFEDLEEFLPKLTVPIAPNNANYSMLCTELKNLYVAVTRPKKRLLIFDDIIEKRSAIEAFWKYMDVVEFVNVDVMPDGTVSSNAFSEGFAKKTSKNEWKTQGLRMFSRKYFEQAEKCFELAGERLLQLRSRGYTLANQAGEVLTEIDTKQQQREWEKISFSRGERKQIRLRKAHAHSLFNEAAEAFLSISSEIADGEKVKKEAARCFSSAGQHGKAAVLFKELGLHGQAAEAEIGCGNFEVAGDLFTLKGEYQRAIETYKQGSCWDKIIKVIHIFKDKMDIIERQKYIQKYMPAALEMLTPKLIPQDEQETQYISQIVKEIPSTIAELSDESESENEKITEIQEKPVISLETSQVPLENSIIPSENSIISSENSIIPSENSSSFVLISSNENSFAILSEGIDDVDPEDEWLQLEAGSIVESLGSIINPDGTIASDYSLLDMHPTSIGKLIKTRGDIYIEDLAMRKIIEYISMFSDEVGAYLSTLRSAESLLSSHVFNSEWEMASLIDLDDISPPMLGLILDTLEEYGMYKLCLIVCNRYNIVDRAGRYVVSLAFKYSNLSMVTHAGIKLKSKEQVQRAAIAFTALHNVLEMLNPCYLDLEKESGTLGIETFQGLVMLGYWKKVVFVVDLENAKALAWSFGDFRAYQSLSIHEENGKSIEELLVEMDLYTQNVLKHVFTEVPLNCPYTVSILSSPNSISQMLLQSFPVISSYFNDASPVNPFEIYDICNFYSIFLQKLKDQFYIDLIIELTSSEFEQFLYCANYLLKYLKTGEIQTSPLEYMRHCLLSSCGVRSIFSSPITSIYPIYSHSLLLSSSPLLGSINQNSIFAADLECLCYLVPNLEINKVFIEILIGNLNYAVEARTRCCISASDYLNSLGEVWMTEFIASAHQYSLKSFDYMAKVSPEVYTNYLKLLQAKAALGVDDNTDIYYAEYLYDLHKKEVKKLDQKIQSLEKTMANAQPGERVKLIHELIDICKYYDSSDVNITKSTKQALLTHAQVQMVSSESNFAEMKFTNIWMAYELCRIGGHHLAFIEMLRARNRTVVWNGKKQCKVSVIYSHAMALADITVYQRYGCYSNIAETLLDLFEMVECTNEAKVFLLQKAVVCWSFGYSTKVKLPKTFEKFLQAKTESVVKGGENKKYRLLEYCCNSLTEFAIKAIPDHEKQDLLEMICDCIITILNLVPIDEKVLSITRLSTFKSGLNIAHSLLPYNCLFKTIEELALHKKIPLDFEGIELEITRRAYPEAELDKEWYSEVKNIAVHQFAANLLSGLWKTRPRTKRISLQDHVFSIRTKKIINFQRSQLLETCQKYLKELLNVFYRVTLFKSLDMHYLLDQLVMVTNVIANIDEADGEKVLEVQSGTSRLVNWKNMVAPNNNEHKEKVKKRWNVNWKKRLNDLKKKRHL